MKLFLKYVFICFISFFHINTFAQSIYDGGNGDGFTISCYAQADNIAFNIYDGGNSDGFSIDCYSQADNIAFDIYGGGNSDGFSIDCYTQLDNPLFFIYGGGNGDGNGVFCAGTITEVPLPIELISFNAILVNYTVQLDWQTATEINNDFFTVERSKDALNWEKILIVEGAGNSNQLLNYNSIDEQPYFNLSYYRLKQTDFDGNYTYSDISAIDMNLPKSDIIIYPNPTNSQITIQADKEELKNLKIFNILGQDLTRFVEIININDIKITLDLTRLPQGIYTIKTKTTSNKVYKQ